MKTLVLRLVLVMGCLHISQSAEAQILKKLKKAVERTAERKLEKKAEDETSKTMDSILEPGT